MSFSDINEWLLVMVTNVLVYGHPPVAHYTLMYT